VGLLGYIAITFAKGYRLDFKTLKMISKGILVVKTDPTGAQVFVDKDLIGASDSNLLSLWVHMMLKLKKADLLLGIKG